MLDSRKGRTRFCKVFVEDWDVRGTVIVRGEAIPWDPPSKATMEVEPRSSRQCTSPGTSDTLKINLTDRVIIEISMPPQSRKCEGRRWRRAYSKRCEKNVGQEHPRGAGFMSRDPDRGGGGARQNIAAAYIMLQDTCSNHGGSYKRWRVEATY